MAGRKKKKFDETTIIKDYDLPNPPSTTDKGKTYKELYKPENAEIAGRLVAAGFTEDDLAYTFNVKKRAVKTWKNSFPAFKAACIGGKQREKRKLVAKSLLAAVGYDYKTSKTKTHMDAEGNVVKIERTDFKSHQPPNHNLLMFLLCNMSHQLGDTEDEKWQSKQKMEIEQNKNVNIQITGEVATEQIRKLAGRLLDEKEERPKKQVECREVN